MGNTDKFNAIARRYDTEERAEIARHCSDTIRAHIGKVEEKSAIDFGCGTGLVGLDLLDSFASVLFIDSSQKMIEIVKEKIESRGVANAEALCFDLETEPSRDIHADFVIIVQTLLHIKNIDMILAKLFHLLNTGGHLIIIDFDKNESIFSEDVHNGFIQEELKAALEDIGFIDVEGRTFFHGRNIFMNTDASLFIMDGKKPLNAQSDS